VWAGWGKEEATMESLFDWIIETWDQAHEGVAQIEWMGWPWSETQKQLVLISNTGTPPDVAQLSNEWQASLVAGDALADLNSLIDRSWMQDTYVESTLLAGNVDGKQYSLPWTASSIGMLYNPQLLSKAGYAVPPTTIDQFEDCLATLKKLDPEIIPYAAMTKTGSTMKDFQQWLWTYGASILDANGNVVINSPAAVRAVEWYKELYDKGYISIDIDRFDARTLFVQGKVGFYDDALVTFNYLAGLSGLSTEEFNKRIYPMYRPVLKYGDEPQAMLWGYSLAVFEASEHKELAADFIKYVTATPEVALKAYEDKSVMPVIKKVVDNPVVQNNAWDRSQLQITQYARTNELENYANYAQLQDIVAETIKAVLIGQKTPQRALDDAAVELEAALSKINEG
jgi:multiple sugar transport system substrate-binding protein